jgi:flavin-binding protein dodecin
MSIIKVIELMSNSTKSWEDATQQAINEASKSVKNIRSVYVKDHCVMVENNKIKQYRVTVNLSFEIQEKITVSKKK